MNYLLNKNVKDLTVSGHLTVAAPRGGGIGGNASPQLSPRLIFQFVEIRTENGRGGGGGGDE